MSGPAGGPPPDMGMGYGQGYMDPNGGMTFPAQGYRQMQLLQQEQLQKRQRLDDPNCFSGMAMGGMFPPGSMGGAGRAAQTPESQSKAQQREMNRQHARNTRARKKQHLESLQSRIKSLEAEKTAKAEAKSGAAKELAKEQQTWHQALKTVLEFRTSGRIDEERWRTILSEEFKFTLPITPYRSYNPTDLVNSRRIVVGVDGMASDTASLMVMCENIAPKSIGKESPVNIEYLLSSSEHMFMGPSGLMSTFLLRTTDAVAKGAACELEQSGMIRAQFGNDGKLEEMDMMFDAIAWYQQLSKATRVESFPVIPNSLAEAYKLEKENVVITTAQQPFIIQHINKAWTNLCGYTLDECEGKPLSILKCTQTDSSAVEALHGRMENHLAASAVLDHQSKSGTVFRNHLQCYPLADDPKTGEITSFAIIMSALQQASS
ncbi:unnamed protein product [Chrysoparadoxa australica]